MSTAVYPSMAPAAQDPIQVLLVKAGYYTQTAAEALGGPFTTGMYADMTPRAQDPIQVLLAKLAYWAEQAASGGGAAAAFSWIRWEDTGPNPAGPPTDPTKAGMVRFRDGNPPVVYDPVAGAYM